MHARPIALGFVGAALLAACHGERPEYPAWTSDRTPPTGSSESAVAPPDGPPSPPAPSQGRPAASGPSTTEEPNAAQLGAPRSPQLVMPAQEGSKSLTTAAEAPLHELNLVRERIPPVLLLALADPYAYPKPLTCETISDSIARLTVALGPDFDNLPPKQKRKITGSGGLGLQLANGAAGNLLPFHGYIGTLSGSARHDELIIQAIGAGAAQRAYLKGLGEARGCRAPAAPRHQTSPAPSIYDGPRKPKYPIN